MTEEKNGVKNGEANTEMAPQEDGTKIPLTNSDAAPEARFTSGENPPNGEAKVDMVTVPTFSGLSKEDLMKYSDDPFWIRLRWFLFILFWAGWVAMLVVAIVIIVQAPRCAPKETLDWVQESAMVDYDVNNPVDADISGDTTPEDLIRIADDLGVTTVYLSALISPQNFEEINDIYNKEEVLAVLEAAKREGLHVVTDFVPTQVGPDNTWFKDGNMSDFFKPNSGELNFENQGLLDKLKEVLRDSWTTKGVEGFLMAVANTVPLQNARTFLNDALKEEVDGAVVSGVADMKDELVSGFNAGMYRKFLDEHVNDWSYYKYNPRVAEGTIPDVVHLVTMSLFLVPGTPVLDGFDESYLASEKETINLLSMLREKESVQVGNMSYVEDTNENVIAYARVMKGTPGYAVAINMHSVNETSVDFTSIEGVPEKGEVHLMSSVNGTQSGSVNTEKKDLASIVLGPLEGIVLQFVPRF